MQVTSASGGKILLRRNWYRCLQITNKKTSGGETYSTGRRKDCDTRQAAINREQSSPPCLQ
eukprot:scaffold8142_cov142-Skeletonema_marinoi.AAC.2